MLASHFRMGNTQRDEMNKQASSRYFFYLVYLLELLCGKEGKFYVSPLCLCH